VLTAMLDGLWALHQTRGWYHGAVRLAHDLLGVLARQPQSPQRLEQELAVQTSLARGLMAVHGYTDEVEAAFERALKLQGDDTPASSRQRFPMLRSLAALHSMRAEFDRSLAAGRELLAIAEDEDDVQLLAEAHLVVGSSAFVHDMEDGIAHLDAAIARFEPTAVRARGLSLGAHPAVASLAASALLRWLTGFPEQATSRAERAVRASEQLGHPFTRTYALFHAAYLDFWRRATDSMVGRADTLLGVAKANDYPIWQALATLLQGVAQVAAGEAGGLARMEHGMSLYATATTPPVFWPLVLDIRAAGLSLAGEYDAALALSGEALGLTPDESPFFAETALRQGDIMLARDRSDVVAATVLYQRGYASAERLRLSMPQLRLATRLADLAGEEPQRGQAVARLRAVYDGFTEGHTVPDLVAAADRLDRRHP
jgi:tetratricopeptide (TPR) repeat protein